MKHPLIRKAVLDALKAGNAQAVTWIPLAVPLTTAFKEESKRLTETDLAKEMAAALRNQLRLIVTR